MFSLFIQIFKTSNKILLTTLLAVMLLTAACDVQHSSAGQTTTSTTTTQILNVPETSTTDPHTLLSIPVTTSTNPTTSTTIKSIKVTTTTAAPISTTTVNSTTSTTKPSVTTTTRVATTTTTKPGGGNLNFTHQLAGDGVELGTYWLWFGMEEPDALTMANEALGQPSYDSGWVNSFSEFGTCPGVEVRGVRYGDFTMLYTTAETDYWPAGISHFFAYTYNGPTPHMETVAGIGIGSTVDDLYAAYDIDVNVTEHSIDPGLGEYSVYLGDWSGIYGTLTGVDGTSQVLNITGGRGCAE